MKTYHNYNMFDGAVLVAENGKIIYKDAFGLANREWNIANTVDTKFRDFQAGPKYFKYFCSVGSWNH